MRDPNESWAELAGTNKQLAAAVGDLRGVLHALVPQVIGNQTVALDANGQAGGQFRLPYRCLVVDSQSAKVLTVANAPLGIQPGAGVGIGFVRVGGYSVLNIAGYTWAIYGGNAGELVTVAAYANPQQPYAR